ncbi:MAG: argininosuccinate lyase [Anaerolineaceae bacterium]|nr:MAG: argininosuccinate lyase [Anaerolineaceae bacterium]
MALWGGRFSQQPDDLLRKLNDSIGFDRRFYAEDIEGSIVYAGALARAGVLTPEEAQTIQAGLKQVRAEFESGDFVLAEGDEDIHTAVERRLTEIVGEVGGKLHTGRSRNDQVATDFRLWVMRAIRYIDGLLADMQTALIAQSAEHTETVMPGYTHLQPAQPISTAHWLMSFFWMLTRDRQRLRDAYDRSAVLPLGSGALAGSPFAVDRVWMAAELGFRAIAENSLDAVSDRDFVTDTLYALTMTGVHLSRFAEDLILYSNPAFGFVTLDDRYSTGSSLMPQKRNADPMELARAKSGRLVGLLTGLLTTLKGLPSGYNKDLQEDKEPIFAGVDTLSDLLPVLTAIISTLKLNPQRMRDSLGGELLATELADYLVDKGLPFRQAHHVIGGIVHLCAERACSFNDLSLQDYQAAHPSFGADVFEWLDFDRAMGRRVADGGTAPVAVRQQIDRARAWMRDFSV